MKSFLHIFTYFLVLALPGCQTTSSEATDEPLTEKPAQVSEKAASNQDAMPIYKPTDGEKLSYALVQTDKIPKKQLRILEETIENGLRDGGKLADNKVAAKQIEVLFTSYRMRSPGVRFSLGILAGKDRIETVVNIKDSKSGDILHSHFFRTGSAKAWAGIGNALRKHANKVVTYIVQGKTRR